MWQPTRSPDALPPYPESFCWADKRKLSLASARCLCQRLRPTKALRALCMAADRDTALQVVGRSYGHAVLARLSRCRCDPHPHMGYTGRPYWAKARFTRRRQPLGYTVPSSRHTAGHDERSGERHALPIGRETSGPGKGCPRTSLCEGRVGEVASKIALNPFPRHSHLRTRDTLPQTSDRLTP